MNGREGGTFSRDIVKAKNGRWTFIDKTTRLKPGDVIYYWTYVDYFDGERTLGYPNDDQMFTVTGKDIYHYLNLQTQKPNFFRINS